MQDTRTRATLALATLVALGLAAAHPQAASAQGFFNNNSGLLTTHTTITFDTPISPLSDGDRVNTQFAGVTFTSGTLGNAPSTLFYDSTNRAMSDAATGFSGAYIENYNPANGNITNGPFDITFTGPVNAAAFAVADQGNVYTFDALLNGVVIDTSGQFTVPYNPGAGFIGFRGETFDTIRVTKNTPGTSFITFDTLQYRSAVATPAPEPSSVAAFAATALGAGVLMLRARKRSGVTA